MHISKEKLQFILEAMRGPDCGCWAGCSVCENWPSIEQAIKVVEVALAEGLDYPHLPTIHGCAVCGLGDDNVTTGYVCNNQNCPTRVSCTNSYNSIVGRALMMRRRW